MQKKILDKNKTIKVRQFYRNWIALLMLLLGLSTDSFAQLTYCTATNSNQNATGSLMSDVTFGSINNSTGAVWTSPSGYNYYTSQTTSVIMGSSENLTITIDPPGSYSGAIVSVWIDWDQDGTLAPSEWIQVGTSMTNAGSPYTISVPIPMTATPGLTRMRIRSRASGSSNGSGDACTTMGSGETEDYDITVVPATACSGSPTAGTAVSSSTSICPSQNFAVSLSGSTIASGLTYDWQYDDGSGWQSTGGTNFSYSSTFTFSGPVDFRCIVSCGSLSDISQPVTVSPADFFNCYCSPLNGTVLYQYGAYNFITNVEIPTTTLNNPNTTYNNNGYEQFIPPAPNQTDTFFPGITYTINVDVMYPQWQAQYTGVWIDWDMDGTFDNSSGSAEWVTMTPTSTGGTGTFTVPLSAVAGATGLRVRMNDYSYSYGPSGHGPCQDSYYGETEDYMIFIGVLNPCTGTPNPATITGPSSTCPSMDFTLVANGMSIGLNLTYDWQYNDGSGWQTTGGAATTYTQAGGITVPTDYRLITYCANSNQYDTSNVYSVAVNDFYACYCSPNNGTTLSQYGAWDNFIMGVSIPTTTLNNPTTSYNNNGYQQFIPPAANQTDTFFPGISYTINIDMYDPVWMYPGVWIDWDMDGTFDNSSGSTEYVTLTGTSNGATGTFTVPLSAVAGVTGLRVRVNDGSGPFGPTGYDPCDNDYYGETEDYMIFIGTLYPCAGTPNPAVISGPSGICPSIDFTLMASGMSIGLGITYDWQYNDGSGWQTTGGSNTTYTESAGITVPTDYRLITYCANSNQYDTSNVLSVAVNDFFACYCSPLNGTVLYQYGSYNYLTNVEIPTTTLSNPNTTYNNNGYEQFIPPAANQTDTFFPGLTYTINVDLMYPQWQYAGVWIDWDMDGTFDNSSGSAEWVTMTTGSNGATGTFTVPSSAVAGATGLRVRMNDGYGPYGPSGYGPCQDSYYGETEDYMIFIGALYPCAGTPTPATISGVTNICPSIDFTLVATGMSIGLGITYDWQYDDGSGWQTTGGSNTTYTQAGGITVPTDYRLITYCANSNQYDTSNVHSVVANDFYACYCSPVTDGTVLSQYGLYDNFITNVSIPSTTLNNSTTSYNNNGYQSFYPPSASATASLLAGITYTLNVGMLYTYSWYAIGAWMDFDGDGLFDNNTEFIPLTFSTSGPAGTATGTFTVPAGTPQGMTGLRVRMNSWPVQYGGSGVGACDNDYQGETEDYVVTILPPPTCIPPSGINATNITTSSADIGWTANNASILYSELEYAPGNGPFVLGTGTNSGQISPSSGGLYSLTSLNPGAPYSVYIRDICNTGDTSNWSGPYTFFTDFPAIPANDDCTNAVDISDGALYYGSTNGATQTEPPCDGGTATAGDVWYTFTTGPTAGTVYDTVNTGFSGIDVVIQLFSGTCGSLTAEAPTASSGTSWGPTCIDGPAAGIERGSYSLAANTTYYIRVYTFGSGPTGTFSIKVSGNPLAIKLDKLSVVNTGASNRVEWNTLSEERSDKFELERSADGKNFAKIYERQANGEASRYTYMDNNPVKGYNYYRLRMTEANGNAAYSEVVKAFVKSTGFEVDAYPNPVSHDLTVKVSGVQGTDASVQVTDVTGKLIKTVKMTGSVETIDMSGLANGIYLIKYSDANHTQTIRVNKQ